MSIEAMLLQSQNANVSLRKRNAELEGENRKLKDGINAVDMLIEESKGIYGLHLNGYPSSWDELLEGGRYEEWLYDFSKALEDE